MPFDVRRLQTTGNAVLVQDNVLTKAARGAASFDISAEGTLVYVPSDATAGARTLVWVNRQGIEEPLPAPPRPYDSVRLSPDGTRVAVETRDAEEDIWILELARGTLNRFTFDPGRDTQPRWTPDGKRIVFASNRGGDYDLYWRASNQTGPVERLTTNAEVEIPGAFSPGAAQLVLSLARTGFDIGVLSMKDHSITPLIATNYTEANPALSPDGQWMAYESNQSGDEQVYVRPFPEVDDGLWQISTDGGAQPLWAPDGRELFYRNGSKVEAVPIQRKSPRVLSAGAPHVLFEKAYYSGLGTFPGWDVATDGSRFLMIKSGGNSDEAPATSGVVVVQNWAEELNHLALTD